MADPVIRDVFATDPAKLELLNQGVAEVKGGRSEPELRTLRYELSTFVCKGQYEKGLRTLLDSYLANLSKSEQAGVWVSGFFGSGKSHFLKVLRALWADEPFPDGTHPRGITDLTPDLTALLKELTREAQITGGLHAAAGTLGAGASSVRLGLLSIVFKSVGFPERYDLACFTMWLRDHKCLPSIKTFVEAKGLRWEDEIHDFLVSPVIHEAVATHFPDWKTRLEDIGALLLGTFPPDRTDVSNDEMVAGMRSALSRNGKFPNTLLAVDEVQQFIGDSSDRAHQVQEAAEECSKRFGSALLIVGTGQSAMAGTPQLLRLRGRFPVEVQLSDADVDTVVRQIVLRKRPDKAALVQGTLEKYNGEISRHLSTTALATRPEDAAVLVADYPLLPVRRRFWERALRALDVGGTTVQLRNQLKVVYEAVRQMADSPLGSVIPADALYFQLAPILLQTGVLPREVYEQVATLRAHSDPDVQLQARLIALVFLIGRLPRNAAQGGDLGVRADAQTLVDLLVDRLDTDSAEVRSRVAHALATLVDTGQLTQVETEYRVQTREGAAWEAEFQKQRKILLDDDTKLGSARSEAVADAFRRRIKIGTVAQGDSKQARKTPFFFGPIAPNPDAASVPVWIRDAWAESESTIQSDALRAGNESPLVFVALPNRHAEDIKKQLLTLRAADVTLKLNGAPASDEGNIARAGIETRKNIAGEKLESLLDDIIGHAQVIQAGGTEVSGTTTEEALREAIGNALARMFPKFSPGDHAKWDSVLKKARTGDGTALTAVGWRGDVEKHPVCNALLGFTASDRVGAEVRKRFESPPFGWSGDAVDGALYVLLVSDHLRAFAPDGGPVKASSLDRAKIGLTRFRAETVPLTTAERVAVRGLMQTVGVPCKPGDEATAAPLLLSTLRQHATASGGEAPRPLALTADYFAGLELLAGNGLVKRLSELRSRIESDVATWDGLAKTIASRLPRWDSLEALLAASEGLSARIEAQQQRDALFGTRGLLMEPDPVPHLCEQLASALRTELSSARQAYIDVFESEMTALISSDAWQRLAPEKRDALVRKHGLVPPGALAVANEREVIESARNKPLAQWALERAGLPGRFQAVRMEAVQLITPQAQPVTLPKATVRTEAELDQWLAEARTRILEKLTNGPVVL